MDEKQQSTAPQETSAPPGAPFYMRMDPAHLVAPYATVVTVLRSDRDLRLNFGQNVPTLGDTQGAMAFVPGEQRTISAHSETVASVVLAPKTAEELLQLLARQLGFELAQKGEEEDA